MKTPPTALPFLLAAALLSPSVVSGQGDAMPLPTTTVGPETAGDGGGGTPPTMPLPATAGTVVGTPPPPSGADGVPGPGAGAVLPTPEPPAGSDCHGPEDCADGLYCMFDGCLVSTAVPGTCEEKPMMCTLDYTPVCGCDGKTYGNACGAAAEGVNVLFPGECGNADGDSELTSTGGEVLVAVPATKGPPPPTTTAAAEVVAGTCEVGPDADGESQCEEGEYCMVADGGEACGGSTSAKGVCAFKSEVCIEIYDPVCGCDGKTYSNSCKAAGAGVNVLFPGECPKPEEVAPQPSPSGGCLVGDVMYQEGDSVGYIGLECIDGSSFTARSSTCGPDGVVVDEETTEVCPESVPHCVQCGTGVGSALCLSTPDAGNRDCGDGDGDGDGAATDTETAVPETPTLECELGPGVDGTSCGADEYCKLDTAGACAESNVEAGVCTTMPMMCTFDYLPVCGCDGNTYGNACAAEANGVNVVSDFECIKEETPSTPPLVGGDYCVWGPDYGCYETGWPSCCGSEDVKCPEERPGCEIVAANVTGDGGGAAVSNGHKCACEAEEMGFVIDCENTLAMIDALDFLNVNGCTEKGSCDAGTECNRYYLIVQSHNDFCPEEKIPVAIEEGIHDFDESCLGCDMPDEDPLICTEADKAGHDDNGPSTPPLVGGDYCRVWGPDYECYETGWPSCCGSEDVKCPEELPGCEIVAANVTTEAPPVTTQVQETISEASTALPDKGAESTATITSSTPIGENITVSEAPVSEAGPPTQAPSIFKLDFELEPPATPSSASTLFGFGVRVAAIGVVVAMPLF